jgi:hypothetical protein
MSPVIPQVKQINLLIVTKLLLLVIVVSRVEERAEAGAK